MSTQKPDPYDVDLQEGDEPLGVAAPIPDVQSDMDDRQRSTGLGAKPVVPGRRCPSCDYDLTGLFIGGACPECGDRILSVAPNTVRDAYQRMPHWYLRLLSAALTLMALMIIGAFALSTYVLFYGMGQSPVFKMLFGIISLLPFAWFAFVAFICVPPPEREPALGVGRSKPELALAGATALSQIGVLGSVVVSFVAGMMNKTPGASVHWLLLGCSVAGLSLVCLQLGEIAKRFTDDDRARRLGYASVAMLVGNVTIMLLVQPLSLLLLGAGYAYFVWSLWVLGRESAWAVRNADAQAARVERLKEKAKAEFEEAQRQREDRQPFGGPIP